MSDEQVRVDGAGPATTEPDPGATVAVPGEGTTTTVPPAKPGRSRVSGMWAGLIFSAIVLLFLLIFIIQNLAPMEIHFLGAVGTLPGGVALLLAAIAGVLLVAIPGSARIVQLRRHARKTGKHLAKQP